MRSLDRACPEAQFLEVASAKKNPTFLTRVGFRRAQCERVSNVIKFVT